MDQDTILIHGQRVKITHCPPRKAKGSKIYWSRKQKRGAKGALYLAKDSGQIEKP